MEWKVKVGLEFLRKNASTNVVMATKINIMKIIVMITEIIVIKTQIIVIHNKRYRYVVMNNKKLCRYDNDKCGYGKLSL